MKKALLVIDVQAFFLKYTPSNLPARIADYIKSSKYDYVGFTVTQNVDGSNWEKTLGWQRCKSKEDIALAPEFKDLATSRNTFIKHSYSALKDGILLKILREKKIDEMHLCGIDTDACILATAFDAFDHDFKVKILFDLSHSRSGIQEAVKKVVLRNLERN